MKLHPKPSLREAMIRLVQEFEDQDCQLEKVEFSEYVRREMPEKVYEVYGVDIVRVDP